MSVFKACDARGHYGSEVTTELAEQLGRAVGTELGGRAAVVGGDVRPSTSPLKKALIDGLVSAGCRVTDLGMVPTPVFYFAKDELGADGGVMVTGSHNPPGDNGFKISLGPWPITEEELAQLEERIANRDFARGKGSYERADVVGRYRAYIRDKFPRAGEQKVVVDAGNGCYARIAPRVLRDVGYQVVELFCEPDGRFPNRSPNPAVFDNIQALREAVVQSEADLGAAFDGDGDRVVFVDERGLVVESDRSIVLFARHLLSGDGGEVIYDIKCSSIVPEEVRQAGGTPVMEKSGHAFIKTTLLRRGGVMGGEISGHFFFGELGRDDGLYSILLMLQVIEDRSQELGELVDTMPRYPITPDIRLPASPSEVEAILGELREGFAERVDCEISTLDGIRIDWRDGWALVRPSVTQPLVTLRFEARSEARLNEIRELVIAESSSLQKVVKRGDADLEAHGD